MDHSSTSFTRENGSLQPTNENDCNYFGKGDNNFESKSSSLEDSRDIRHSGKRGLNEEKKRKDDNRGSKPCTCQTQLSCNCLATNSFISSPKSQHSISEEEEQVIQEDESTHDEKVQMPTISSCTTSIPGKLSKKAKANWKALSPVNETLPPIQGKRLSPRRKNAAACSPLMNASISLPLLKTSGLVTVVNSCGSKQEVPASVPSLPNSPELTNHSDGRTMADRGEINTLHWVARKRKKARSLRRKYEGLLPEISYERPLK